MCDKLIFMKIFKAIALVLVTVFLFSAVNLCDAAYSADDDIRHCVSYCSAGCHAVVLSATQILIAPSFSAFPIQFDAMLRQELFLNGIEYPPNSPI